MKKTGKKGKKERKKQTCHSASKRTHASSLV
jgi:hypothetical protein